MSAKCFEKDKNGNTIINWPTDMYKGTASLPERRIDSMLLDLVLETKENVLGKKFKLTESRMTYPSPGDRLKEYRSKSNSNCATDETFGSHYHGYRHLAFNIRNYNSSTVSSWLHRARRGKVLNTRNYNSSPICVAYEHRRALNAIFDVPAYTSTGRYRVGELALRLGNDSEFNLLPSTVHEDDANEITGYAKDNIGRYLTSF